MSIADALLDQSAIAGIGNVYKSEVLFVGRINPFAPVRSLTHDQIAGLVAIAVKLLRTNVAERSTANSGRRTTNRIDPSARVWVYGRGGQPCRRCGTPIAHAKAGTVRAHDVTGASAVSLPVLERIDPRRTMMATWPVSARSTSPPMSICRKSTTR
jgi:formamidopyrimidine-DNA glycosylase